VETLSVDVAKFAKNAVEPIMELTPILSAVIVEPTNVEYCMVEVVIVEVVIVEAVRVLRDTLLKLGELVQFCRPFVEMDNTNPGRTNEPSSL
jgi:hypothetical protein